MTVCIATYGDWQWMDLGERAAKSVPEDVEMIRFHGKTLHDARNTALEMVDTEWVIFLDADDELGEHYIPRIADSDADVRVPLVSYIANSRAHRPRYPKVAGHTHDCTAECLAWGNWVVIGACVRADLLREVGGFRDFDWSEDWDLWLRCHLAGATFGVTNAVYRAHVRLDSRNRGASREVRLEAHRAIARANGVPVP